LFDAEDRPTFGDPTVVSALALYADLVTRASPPMAVERGGYRWPSYPVSWGGHPGQTGSGHVAMWADFYGNHREAPALTFQVGVAPLPAGPVSLSSSSLYGLMVSAQAERPEDCWEWMWYLSAQPEAIDLLPVRPDLARSDVWRQRVGDELADAWLAVLEREETMQPPWQQSPAYFSLYWFDEAVANVLAGARPAAALEEAQTKASSFAECLGAGQLDQTAWRACVLEADPAAVLPQQ
jgi:hypothetical protein